MLSVRAAGEGCVGGGFGEVCEEVEEVGELVEEDAVGAAEVEELAGLGDVLGGCAPVDIAAGIAVADAVEFPDHGYEGVSGAGEAFADFVHVEVFVARLALDFLGGVFGDDAEFGLRLRECDFDVEPCLYSRGFAEDFADAWVADAGMRWVRFAFCGLRGV